MKYTHITLAAAAALLTASKGNERNKLRLPSFHGVIEVRASIPGRIRFFIPAVADREQAAGKMKQQLESTGAVRQVQLNARTCTALVFYDPAQVEPGVVEGAVIRLMALDEDIKKRPVSRMETGMRTLWESVNHGVMESTSGLMDARMLAGTALAATALRSLAVNGVSLPGTATLLWWASNVFRGRYHE